MDRIKRRKIRVGFRCTSCSDPKLVVESTMKNWNFKREAGALVDEQGFVWNITLGDAASLLYPDHKIWEMGQSVSRVILAHTHPGGMLEMSTEDLTTLRAWSFALPNRVEMQIIAKQGILIKSMAYAFSIQSYQDWIKQGKLGEREMKLHSFRRSSQEPWINKLVALSYDGK